MASSTLRWKTSWPPPGDEGGKTSVCCGRTLRPSIVRLAQMNWSKVGGLTRRTCWRPPALSSAPYSSRTTKKREQEVGDLAMRELERQVLLSRPRPQVARTPLRDGLPQGRYRPASDGATRSAGRIQVRGLPDVPGDERWHQGKRVGFLINFELPSERAAREAAAASEESLELRAGCETFSAWPRRWLSTPAASRRPRRSTGKVLVSRASTHRTWRTPPWRKDGTAEAQTTNARNEPLNCARAGSRA